MDSAKDSKTYEALAFQGGMEADKMTIKVSEDRSLISIELNKNGIDRFYACSDFATCTVKMDDFLSELERLELIPPRPKTVEHQAQGLLDIEWHHSLQTEDDGCGS